jgi:hypothetical protein
VFISNRELRCDDCGDDLGRHAMAFLAGDRGALCLTCADLDHLTFLPPGDAALTRRARKYSTLAAVVLKWSRARKRYERQGLPVEEQVLQNAEVECLNDAERGRGDATARRNGVATWTPSSWRGSRHAFASSSPAARPIGPSKSRRTRARSTVDASDARRRPNISTRRRCGWRSSHTCVTARRTTTSC